jgi:hypothetical protein
MANPVIIEDEMAENLVYKPAENVIRVKHLLNFTNGTFYPLKGASLHNQLDAYATLHPKEDPITGFFDVVKVCDFYIEFEVSSDSTFLRIKGTLPGVPLKFEPGTSCKLLFSRKIDVLKFMNISCLWLVL